MKEEMIKQVCEDYNITPDIFNALKPHTKKFLEFEYELIGSVK